jgi:hypothetical protein
MAGKTVEEIFGDKLNDATVFRAATFASLVLINDGKGHYTPQQLPAIFQWAPIFSFDVNDYDHDGKADLLAGCNFFGTTPYEGRYDAMPLALGLGAGNGKFKPVLPLPNGFETLRGEVRDIQLIELADHKKGLLLAINNERLRLFEIK